MMQIDISTMTDEEIDKLLKDDNNRPRTQSLFLEFENERYPAIFTPLPYDVTRNGKTYISLYRKYMEHNDPTEYVFARACFGSYPHWKLLQDRDWFKPYVNAWREELDTKIKSESYEDMLKIAQTAKSDQVRSTALKWLADRGYLGSTNAKRPSKRGRPSNAEINAEISDKLKKALNNTKDIESDYERLFGGSGD